MYFKSLLIPIHNVQDTMAAGGGGATPEQQAMAIAEDVLKRLPAKILSGPSHEGDIKPADMTPMSIVVIQEAARYEKLVNIVRTSSRAVIGAVQGNYTHQVIST